MNNMGKPILFNSFFTRKREKKRQKVTTEERKRKKTIGKDVCFHRFVKSKKKGENFKSR
jgi:hypothetical protein